MEADFSSNLLIDGNIFDSYFGGIQIAFIDDHNNFNPGRFQNHANINITNNIIRVRAPVTLKLILQDVWKDHWQPGMPMASF